MCSVRSASNCGCTLHMLCTEVSPPCTRPVLSRDTIFLVGINYRHFPCSSCSIARGNVVPHPPHHRLVLCIPFTCPSVEFPAVLMDVRSGEVVGEFHQYVQPQESPQLSAFCKELTGITQVNGERSVVCTCTNVQTCCALSGVKHPGWVWQTKPRVVSNTPSECKAFPP